MENFYLEKPSMDRKNEINIAIGKVVDAISLLTLSEVCADANYCFQNTREKQYNSLMKYYKNGNKLGKAPHVCRDKNDGKNYNVPWWTATRYEKQHSFCAIDKEVETHYHTGIYPVLINLGIAPAFKT